MVTQAHFDQPNPCNPPRVREEATLLSHKMIGCVKYDRSEDQRPAFRRSTDPFALKLVFSLGEPVDRDLF